MMARDRACVAVLVSVMGWGCVALPNAQPDADVKRVSLGQGWRPADRALFYHQSQGSVVLPYEWFVALEQPEVKFIGTVGLFRDPDVPLSLRFPVRCHARRRFHVGGASPALRTEDRG